MNIQSFFNGEVKTIEINTFLDKRGLFLQSFDDEIKQVIDLEVKQENVSYSNKNVFRGLHYQFDEPMGKLVQCLNGSIIDIVIDIRNNSNTSGQVEFFELKNPNKLLWVPFGFAHGFYSKEEKTIIKYMCSCKYNKKGEGSINFADKTLKILDKLDLKVDNLIISDKDREAQSYENYLINQDFNLFKGKK